MPQLPFSVFANTPAATAAKAVVARLAQAGHEAYFVGGALRDALLGFSPKDVDVATAASLDEVTALFPGARIVGRAYGACLIADGAATIEVVSFRQDGPYADGRHPSWVRPTTRAKDALRRDFTINALAYDPQTGELFDEVGGLEDLLWGRIRAIGDPFARFCEDRLRLFRAVRFAARLGFEVEAETARAIRALAPQSRELAAERVEQELSRMFTGPRPSLALRLLFETGLLGVWLPEVAALAGLAQGARHHPEGDALTHTGLLLEHLKTSSPELAWAALLHDVGKAPCAHMKNGEPFFPNHAAAGARLAGEVAARLRFSKAREQAVCELILRHMTPLDYPALRLAKKRAMFLWPDFPSHLALWRADALARRADPAPLAAIERDYAAFLALPALVAPLLRGDDLLALGIAPGPSLGALLAGLREAQLAGELTTREEALAFLAARRKAT